MMDIRLKRVENMLFNQVKDTCKEKKARLVIPGVYVQYVKRIIKPDVAPGEFKCRTCYTMWSSYMENHILCTDTTERYGLHNFDFAKRII